jgi:hypothetical protein
MMGLSAGGDGAAPLAPARARRAAIDSASTLRRAARESRDARRRRRRGARRATRSASGEHDARKFARRNISAQHCIPRVTLATIYH